MTTGAEYAQVYVDIPSQKLDRAFTYRIPPALKGKNIVGMRVLVPFGARTLEGYVTGLCTEAELAEVNGIEVKEITRALDEGPIFTQAMLELAGWMAEHYLCSYVQALQCIMPAGIKVQGKKFIGITPAGSRWLADPEAPELDGQLERVMELLEDHGGEVETGVVGRLAGPSGASALLAKLKKLGFIQEGTLLNSRVQKKKKTGVRLLFPIEKLNEKLVQLGARASKQAAVLAAVARTTGLTVSEVAAAAGTTASTVQSLVQKGLLELYEEEVLRDPYAGRTFVPSVALTPTEEQQAALESIYSALDKIIYIRGNTSVSPEVFLVHGVTGSGKTEIYLQAIAKTLALGLQAIVLVPEISLTPQMVVRFKSRFGSKVAVLHSRLSLGERYDEWRRIKENQVEVVVGARSAVFAPFTRLGLVVIDEEHEGSYKQDEKPRYHARSVALKRAELEGAVVLLGSATPAVETFYQAENGNYRLITLRERVDNRPLPEVKIVDMRQELQEGNRSIFSELLARKIRDRLDKKEQTILFLNRRGFSTFVVCRECGCVLKCPHCDIALTYHAPRQNLRCHYCDYQEANPEVCPKCGSKYIRYFGAGTQRVEEELKKIFPQAGVLRMDVDTTTRKGAHEAILTAFQQGEVDVLVGTQMIAKGLDFPNVTLVGVISADTSLNIPDFRSGERTFQLLTQVAGRAGRGNKPGEVVVQTYSPEHYSIVSAQKHDYCGFFREEIELRETLDYPPFCSLVRLVFTARDEQKLIREAHGLAGVFKSLLADFAEGYQLLGPAPAPLSRIRNRFRWHLALKGPETGGLLELVKRGIKAWSSPTPGEVQISIDVEPQAMM
ncbi:MAG: primosomal protein N' [Clostridia bacterium]|nr:primosomal protein N' [Clostridia bacterium]